MRLEGFMERDRQVDMAEILRETGRKMWMEVWREFRRGMDLGR